jgi:hypothetical protein
LGNVAVLTTSGDNDPELEPVQYYRHYLYCDRCGSFELESWQTGQQSALDRYRERLGLAALWATPLVAVPAWQATGVALSLSLLVYVAIGIVLAHMLFARIWGTKWPIAPRWRFVVRALPWLAAFLLAEWLCSLLPRWGVAAAGTVLIAVALVWRTTLASRVEPSGLRCRQCGATFAGDTAFFRDLDANPHHLSVSDVPRPLGRSPFLKGRIFDTEPARARAPLP